MTGFVPRPFVRTRSRAFGLVEIAISLGVVSFALLALIGLTVVGLNSSREAHEDTVVASLARHAVSELSSLNYTNLAALSTTNFYYTYDGAVTNASADSVYYACRVNFKTPATTAPQPMRQFTLEFSWPQKAANTNVTVFSSSIAEH